MATFIPIIGEITLVPPPKSEGEVSVVLNGKPTDLGRHQADAESFYYLPSAGIVNERASYFQSKRGLWGPLFGPVLILSAGEQDALEASEAQASAPAPVAAPAPVPAQVAAPAPAPSGLVLVTGNTFPVKEELKALGGKWDAVAKGWKVPAAKLAEAQALVAGAPRPVSRKYGAKAASSTLAQSGGSHRTNAKAARCDVCGTHVNVGVGALHYIHEDADDSRFPDHGGWVVTCAPTDAAACSQRRVDNKAAKLAQIAAAKLAASVVQATKLGADAAYKAVRDAAVVGLTKTPSHLSVGLNSLQWHDVARVGHDRLHVTTLPSGETAYREWLFFHDEERSYYYLPQAVAEAEWREWARSHNITRTRASEWLAQYHGCEGTEAYQWAAAQPEGV